MAKTKVIHIANESTDDEERYELYVNGGSRATLTKRAGVVSLNWQVYGPQHWPDARYVVQGLLELTMIADQISGGKNVEETNDE